ncbi:MAG TPA: hypothetical protein VM286_05275 [Candidatus Thermoplasmatota archaeon]|nr:hypothetical protein [Candidatus Thermoplasmatota archaeon]
MRALLLTCLVLTIAFVGFSGTAAAQPDPLVHTCSAVTQPCWNGSLFCFHFSQQMPTCLPIGLT